MYFDAKDAAGRGAALTRAVQPAFKVIDGQGELVADGLAGCEPVCVMPDSYTARLRGQSKSQPVTVKPKETVKVRL